MMRFITLLTALLLGISWGAQADNAAPSYSKELLSLPSLDAPSVVAQPTADATTQLTNAAPTYTVATGATHSRLLQSLTGIDAQKTVAKKTKLTLGQKLQLAKQAKKWKKELEHAAPTTGKSQLVALLLGIFVGALGIHPGLFS